MLSYDLQSFIAETLSTQPSPPRQVPILSVARAVLGGADCAIYAGCGVLFIALGLSFVTGVVPIEPAWSAVWGGLIVVGLGVVSTLVAVFRIWQVERALQIGDAQAAEVIQAEVGRPRPTGSLWGDPMATAVKGSYQLTGSREAGHYYMQQMWALGLRPGATIWVVRVNGRDVLYAPMRATPT